MNEYISEVLVNLLNVNNKEELKEIIDKTEEFIKNGLIATDESILLVTKLVELKNKMGLISEEKKGSSFDNLRKVLSKIPVQYPDSFKLRDVYGLFREDNSFTFFVSEERVVKLRQGVTDKIRVLYRLDKGLYFNESDIYYGSDFHIKDELILNNVGNIVDIDGIRTYILKIEDILGYNVPFKYDYLCDIIIAVNTYLLDNPDFIKDIFSDENVLKLR